MSHFIFNNRETGTVKGQPDTRIRREWLGTTQFSINDRIEIQKAGRLDDLIIYQQAIYDNLREEPYDPTHWIELCQCCLTLGFTDIAVAAAHKGLILTRAGLSLDHGYEGIVYPSGIATLVRVALSKKLQICSTLIIEEELKNLLLICYSGLLSSLLACGAFWDGLKTAKTALDIFPGDLDLLEIRNMLKDCLYERQNSISDVEASKDKVALVLMTRVGKIYQTRYPWMDSKFYDRTPVLVRELNKKLASQTCAIKPVTPGLYGEESDVGPLGIFALRDIEDGESVLVDHAITNTSDLSPMEQTYCGACHASLLTPYILPIQIVRPACCQTVAFCSQECCSAAVNGYHQILCGKDWSWTYNHTGRAKSTGLVPDPMWRLRLFLRMVAVYLADIKSTKEKVHPLQHSLFGRMAPNYSSPSSQYSQMTHDWYYYENVEAPTRILMTLGIDPFTDPYWTQEVIQTIFWRIENNANMSKTNLSVITPLSLGASFKESSGKEEIITSINANYIFFNHSCEPNTSWHGPSCTPFGDSNSLMGMHGEIIKPGSATIICRAGRKIKKGEELKISYIGDPMGISGNGQLEGGRKERRRWLLKWFEGGCGCSMCTMEAEGEKALAMGKAEEEVSMKGTLQN